MKKLALAISMVAFSAATSSAADMAVKAMPAPPPVLSWAGFYIGGHGGYGWKDDPFSITANVNPLAIINGFRSRGWLAGGHVGYNWQYAALVGGVELDVSATGIKGNSATSSYLVGQQAITESLGNNVKLLGSARGRLGWAPGSSWLLYGTGGLAWEQLDQTHNFTNTSLNGVLTANISSPVNLFGWVLGAGVETRLMGSNWIGRLEYLHYDLGHSRGSIAETSTLLNNQFSLTNTAGNQTIDVVRAGLSYKFGN